MNVKLRDYNSYTNLENEGRNERGRNWEVSGLLRCVVGKREEESIAAAIEVVGGGGDGGECWFGILFKWRWERGVWF